MSKGAEQTFLQRRYRAIDMVNRCMKRHSISLIIREMQIQIHNKISLPLVRMAVIKIKHKAFSTKMWRKGNPCTLLVEIQIGIGTMENGIEVPQ